MATATEAIASHPSSAVPYVGLRPFEPRERDCFFGRERDAQILCDRILSGRLTILYALSGLGKSSLLRALVIPKLEEEHARVVYFDSWSQHDPLAALKENLASLASRAGVPAEGQGSLSLIELVKLLGGAAEQGLVLVFDQFEEFLVRHAQNLDPFRSELAAVIRASRLDVAVVLTLREEFLAALEPFRQHLVNLFQSAYRLENLSDEDLGRAIREPARLFGGECEKELTSELIKDLKGEEADLTVGSQLAVGLPELQLVCQELWKQAAGSKLTLALYESQGRAKRIIDKYVTSLMPRTQAAQSLTAHLLTYLAPPSGLKMSYSVEDLAAITELKAANIEGELRRLSSARILRTREYRAGLRYELEHDAFIPVLRSWRSEVLEREKRMHWLRRGVGVAAILLVVLLAVGYALHSNEKSSDLAQKTAVERANREKQDALNEKLRKQQMDALKAESQLKDLQAKQAELGLQELEEWRTGGFLAELKESSLKNTTRNAVDALAASRFDVLTSYDLLERKDEQRFADLKRALEKYQDLVPVDYAEPVNGENASPETAALTIEAPQSLDRPHFMVVWRDFAKELARTNGIPVPLEVQFTESKGKPGGRTLKFIGADPTGAVELQVPANDNEYLIRYPIAKIKDSGAKTFLERFRPDWRPFEGHADWLTVPRWSLPVWKLAKSMTENRDVGVREIATSPGGIAAYRSLVNLLDGDRRKIFFTERAAAFLIQSLPQSYQTTLAEAKAARGSCLAADAAKRMQVVQSALALPQILDQLADQPAGENCFTSGGGGKTGKPRTAQSGTDSAADSGDDAKLGLRLRGPWPQNRENDRQEIEKSFAELKSQLPPYQSARIYVGNDLTKTWIPNNRPSEALAGALSAVRNELYQEYGVVVPTPQFSNSPMEGDAPQAHAIRFAIEGDPLRAGALLKSVNVERVMKGADPAELEAPLRTSYQQTRGLWITPEGIQEQLNRLPNNTQHWLQGKYSVTDLKKVFRSAVSTAEAGQGGSARYGEWLMSSLFFWAAVEKTDLLNGPALLQHVRRLQQVRRGSRADMSATVRDSIERGADALLADNLDLAGSEFGFALAQDRQAAQEAFCAAWRKRLPEVWLRDFGQNFSSLRDLKLDDNVRLDLADLPEPDVKGQPKVVRELTVYRLAAGVVAEKQQLPAVRELLNNTGPGDGWPAEPARWLAVRFLQQYDPLNAQTGTQRQLDTASALLKSAVTSFDQQAAFDAFGDLEKLSNADTDARYRPAPVWCWKLFDELAAAKPNGGPAVLNLKFELAWRLADEERPDRLRQATSMLDTYERLLRSSSLTDAERKQQNELVDYTTARIDRNLQKLGEDQRFAEAERLYKSLLGSKSRPDLSQAAYKELAEMFYERGRDSEAHKLIEEAEKQFPDDVSIPALELFAQMERGNGAGVSRIVQDENSRAVAKNSQGKPDEENAALFYATLGSVVMQSSGWRDAMTRSLNHPADNQYRDYLLMIFNAYSPQPGSDGARFLDVRWAAIRPDSWNGRLMNGDVTAWREMLIGRFKDDPRARDLLDTVEDEEKWQASNFSQLPMSRDGERTEAWFYEAMRAKKHGDTNRMSFCLKKCVDAKLLSYEEHSLAAFLLKQNAGQPQSAKISMPPTR